MQVLPRLRVRLGVYKRMEWNGMEWSLRLCLGGGEGMEWNGIKRIFLEYSSLLLFGSFNGGNGMYIPLFGSLSGREWNG